MCLPSWKGPGTGGSWRNSPTTISCFPSKGFIDCSSSANAWWMQFTSSKIRRLDIDAWSQLYIARPLTFPYKVVGRSLLNDQIPREISSLKAVESVDGGNWHPEIVINGATDSTRACNRTSDAFPSKSSENFLYEERFSRSTLSSDKYITASFYYWEHLSLIIC